ncbi:tetratricopeptide repeat-containing sensor histidine kinase [Carboxylicivirga sp. N1Y90]|uniref:tetratricopeptide repeat-containing sensor histidine kinase n=1 Tax=Carboxylicivirga fragile TaxID=3417571 RepID=UPI003D334F63|nr:tetratricopeptide repeat protein [Marinilabiliaceae bacterium N1Y90]
MKTSIAVFIVFLTSFCSSPSSERNIVSSLKNSNDLTPDSLIVDQLIQKSKEAYELNEYQVAPLDDFLKEAIELAVQHKYRHQLFNIYNLIGKRYRNKSLYAQSMEYLQKSLYIAEELDDPHQLSEIYNQIGTVYRRIDENSKALEMHMKALTIAENIKDSFLISVSINGMGNVSNNLNRYLSAIEYFQKSLGISKKMNNKLGIAINTNNIGDIYQKLNKPDSALFYHFEALDYNSQINSTIGQSICYNSIGSVYTTKKQYRLALEYLFKALEVNLEVEDGLYIAVSYNSIGKTYLEDNHPQDALTYLKKGLDVSQKIGAKYTAEEAARLMSAAYEKQQNYTKALKFHKLSAVYKDSMINEKNIFHISTAEADYERNLRTNQLNTLSEKNVFQSALLIKQRMYLLIAGIMLSILLLLIILLIYQARLRGRYRTLRFQQRLLRSQMNPHFIFNALSAIQVFILENDMAKSSRFLSDFSKLMRQVLRSSNYEYITINEEVEILQYYLNLQQLRFTPSFEYEIEIDSTLKENNILVPPMLIQPFVENAIEHGLKPIGEGGVILIRFNKSTTGVVIEVDDNGLGIDYSNSMSKNDKKHESMALKITKERLDILEKDTKKKTIFEVFDKKRRNPNHKGTVVRFTIPLIRYEQ